MCVGICFGSLASLMTFAALNEHHRRSSLANGHKVVVMLASNVEGGVMEVKGAREWEIERNSIQNKEQYTKRWGFEFETVNMMTQRRYSQEWREGWEKVDLIRETMRKYPDAVWSVLRTPFFVCRWLIHSRFWWLDLNTWIMEPSYSLQDHIFNRLDAISYRDVNAYPSLEHGPPPANTYFDEVALAPNGDRDISSIDLILSQDCGSLNLGSFLIRRSTWTDRLLDIWWDPVLYEQNYMEWQHKEQDALGHLYDHHPWIRARVAFVPQRYINSFPPGACGDSIDPAIHYQEKDRDFVVNMANCQSGRDCLGEMDQFRESSDRLNGVVQKRCMNKVKQFFRKMFGIKEQPRQA